MKILPGFLTKTAMAAGIATTVMATNVDEAKAQTVEFDFGITIRPDYGHQPRVRIAPDYNQYSHERRPRYYQHPSQQNTVRCVNIPNNGPHGGTHRVCSDGYDSRVPTRPQRHWEW